MDLEHALIKPGTLEDRGYQAALAERALAAPHLLILPTGLGKTVVALRVLLEALRAEPERRVLFLAPTKPLCDQHGALLRRALRDDVAVAVFTGDTTPARRDAAWGESRVIVATPQVIQNDVVRGARNLSDVSLVIYDEAHRAMGHYAYVFIARRYAYAGGRHALGLTASPGNDAPAVQRVMKNLYLARVEVRTERDADVAPFVHDVATEWIRVRPSSAGLRLIKLLERMYGRAVLALRRLGYLEGLRGLPSRKDLLALGARLRGDASGRAAGRAVYEGVSLQARALKLQHALELVETQGSAFLYRFLQRLEQEAVSAGGSKAARDLVREPEFVEAMVLARDDEDPAPKQARILGLVRDALDRGHRRVLVFANYRETADALVAALERVEGVRVSRFVGHARAGGERGLTRREQETIVERFRSGDLNVLVATAVGEEGLDLPETDTVIVHEPVASAIRFVQRRGRTGRRSDGRLVVLLMEGTRDETYHWNAVRRERKMLENLAALRRIAPLHSLPEPVPPRPAPRDDPAPGHVPEVTMDPREASSALAHALLERGLRIKASPLATGDYSVSDRVLVERKTAADLAASLKDGRFFEQVSRLARAPRAVLLVEGDPFRDTAGLSPRAMAGALAAVTVDHGVSVVTVPNAEAGADYVASLARREALEGRNRPLRLPRSPHEADAQLRFVLEGVPHVGPVTARALLERFGSLEAVASAATEDLEEVPGVGPETARAVHDVFHRRYASPTAPPVAVESRVPVAALEGGDGAAR